MYRRISEPLLISRGYKQISTDGIKNVWKSPISLFLRINEQDDNFWCDSLAEGKTIIIKTYQDLLLVEEYVNCLKTGNSTKGYKQLKEALGI